MLPVGNASSACQREGKALQTQSYEKKACISPVCHLEMLYLPVKVTEPKEMFYVLARCLHCSQDTSARPLPTLCSNVFICLFGRLGDASLWPAFSICIHRLDNARRGTLSNAVTPPHPATHPRVALTNRLLLRCSLSL